MFQPSMRNLRRSSSTLWKKHSENKSFLYLSCLWQRANCWSVISWYSRFMFAFKPWEREERRRRGNQRRDETKHFIGGWFGQPLRQTNKNHSWLYLIGQCWENPAPRDIKPGIIQNAKQICLLNVCGCVSDCN